MTHDEDDNIQVLKENLVEQVSQIPDDRKILSSDYLKNQGELLDDIFAGNIYQVNVGGLKGLPIVFMNMNQAGILAENSNLNISKIERVGAAELKKQTSGGEHSSARIFQKVVNDKQVFVIQRRNVDTALIIGLDRVKNLLGMDSAPRLSSDPNQMSGNQAHFNQLVKTYFDDPDTDVVVLLTAKGELRLEISQNGLNELRNTIDEYGLTPQKVIAHIRNNYDKPDGHQPS